SQNHFQYECHRDHHNGSTYFHHLFSFLKFFKIFRVANTWIIYYDIMLECEFSSFDVRNSQHVLYSVVFPFALVIHIRF
ncbi:unnamed protein product, partial [Prunus brigantina]